MLGLINGQRVIVDLYMPTCFTLFHYYLCYTFLSLAFCFYPLPLPLPPLPLSPSPSPSPSPLLPLSPSLTLPTPPPSPHYCSPLSPAGPPVLSPSTVTMVNVSTLVRFVRERNWRTSDTSTSRRPSHSTQTTSHLLITSQTLQYSLHMAVLLCNVYTVEPHYKDTSLRQDSSRAHWGVWPVAAPCIHIYIACYHCLFLPL